MPDAIDQYSVACGPFEIRARALREGKLGLNAPGGIHSYESRHDAASSWLPITSFRYSTADMIPRDQIRFVNDTFAYFFHEFVFAVTTDGGKTWTVRGEPDASFDTLHQWTSPRIQAVTMNESGRGTMRVSAYPWQQLRSTELSTDDFGKTWK